MISPPPSSELTQQWLAFLTPISIAILAVVQVLIGRFSDSKAAKRAEEVKKSLGEATEKSNNKISEIHTLVNSERGILLGMYATAMEDLAQVSKTPAAQKAAQIARAMSDDHNRKQAAVDDGQKNTEEK